MHTNSETEFLNAVLSANGYNPDGQNRTQILASLCRNHHKVFLKICSDLFKIIIFSLLQSAPGLSDNVLETIANDLSEILGPLWGLQAHSELVSHVFDARNMASYAAGEKNKRTKGNYIKGCFDALDKAYKYLGGI